MVSLCLISSLCPRFHFDSSSTSAHVFIVPLLPPSVHVFIVSILPQLRPRFHYVPSPPLFVNVFIVLLFHPHCPRFQCVSSPHSIHVFIELLLPPPPPRFHCMHSPTNPPYWTSYRQNSISIWVIPHHCTETAVSQNSRKLTVTSIYIYIYIEAIGIHATKASFSQLVNFKNAIRMSGHFRRTICNKILF